MWSVQGICACVRSLRGSARSIACILLHDFLSRSGGKLHSRRCTEKGRVIAWWRDTAWGPMVSSPWEHSDASFSCCLKAWGMAVELGDNAFNQGMKVEIRVQTLQSLDVANY